jgi:hypothetical protein
MGDEAEGIEDCELVPTTGEGLKEGLMATEGGRETGEGIVEVGAREGELVTVEVGEGIESDVGDGIRLGDDVGDGSNEGGEEKIEGDIEGDGKDGRGDERGDGRGDGGGIEGESTLVGLEVKEGA